MYNDKKVPLLRTGIAWPSDKNIKYQNPKGNLKYGILHCLKYLTLKFRN